MTAERASRRRVHGSSDLVLDRVARLERLALDEAAAQVARRIGAAEAVLVGDDAGLPGVGRGEDELAARRGQPVGDGDELRRRRDRVEHVERDHAIEAAGHERRIHGVGADERERRRHARRRRARRRVDAHAR